MVNNEGALIAMCGRDEECTPPNCGNMMENSNLDTLKVYDGHTLLIIRNKHHVN
jgi:hypothetical protein